ncbi:OLC1v1014825C1 [Oldenlandia corymbosa var. corymbosa]|uniref:OLC1v1014825C1 n=1 Tax=Oldenlandia corymbosa var. corymbosa TaxID=529605 RepID=A0AAV1E413_OLDCO|nr:OLC1v1014825C1 [Oldenlandia corymbosa var. corymbosa]
MLERALSLSTRRSPPVSEDMDDVDDKEVGGRGDESKNHRMHFSIAAMRFTHYFTRTGYLWPLIILGILIFVVCSIFLHTRDLVCLKAATSDHISRLRFFGFDDVESDFGSLGVPWCRSKLGKTVEWTTKDLLRGLEEFVPIYETRPIKNNMYGMGFDHSFGLWFIARWLKPELMIESGAFKGHSTWVLRQAMPDTRIVSLSPRHPEKYLKKGPAYVDGNCTYFAGKDFVDFGSIDWGSVMKKHGIKDLTRVLVFFDDHQNELKRLKQAIKAGFRHLVFEDNYDTGTGDHYSFRQICDQFYIRGGGHSCFRDSDEARMRTRRKKIWEKAVDIDELCGPGEAWWGVRGQMRDDFNHSNKAITHSQHFQNSRYVESVLDIYWELPPVAGPSLTHQTRYDPARVTSPIVEDGRYGLFQRLGLSRLETSVFNGYTQMVYLQVSEQDS